MIDKIRELIIVNIWCVYVNKNIVEVLNMFIMWDVFRFFMMFVEWFFWIYIMK